MNFRAGDRVITSRGCKKRIVTIWKDYVFFEDASGCEARTITTVFAPVLFCLPGLEKDKRYSFAKYNEIMLCNRRMDI